MKKRDNPQVFEFILSDGRYLRATLTLNDDGSFSPGLSEIQGAGDPANRTLLSPVPCEQGSGHYEAFIQLLGVVLWKAIRTDTRLQEIKIKSGVDMDCENTLVRIIGHFAPGVKLVRQGSAASPVSPCCGA
ncbi:TPA: hypothetical protein NBP20_004954 [Enterobacter hormaechei]|nr:hypothetical protein [Enterobacter hormaechei]